MSRIAEDWTPADVLPELENGISKDLWVIVESPHSRELGVSCYEAVTGWSLQGVTHWAEPLPMPER